MKIARRYQLGKPVRGFAMSVRLALFAKWIGVPIALPVLAYTALSVWGGKWWLPWLILLALALPIWAVALLACVLRATFRRDWKTCAVLILALLCSPPLILIGALSGDYVHLAVMSPYYLIKTHMAPEWHSKPFRFYWSDQAVIATNGIQAKTLIYDASGKTIPGDRPDTIDTGLMLEVQHVVGNFYLETLHSP